MQSKILPLVLEHLKDEHLILGSEVLAASMFSQKGNMRFFECRMFLKEFEETSFCGWTEPVAREVGETLEETLLDKEETQKIMDKVKQEISDSVLMRLVSCHKYKAGMEKNLEAIQKLREEILELEYSPGGRGALQAQKHFEGLVSGL
ncbi:hypothetical protein A9K97_gp454 [Tokyovirus A1]|uniref:hypothetical protein n=1 Tax=Tokyovirus A1 TaxID=1826170 RepID=UPI0007A97B0A|nr:hypothetical protein A9K97_gp454 [Tokyovirus A1]BAU79897.1 hypothetical protein [Tokyovirus A1]